MKVTSTPPISSPPKSQLSYLGDRSNKKQSTPPISLSLYRVLISVSPHTKKTSAATMPPSPSTASRFRSSRPKTKCPLPRVRGVAPLRPPNRRDLRSPALRRRNPLPLTINFELVLHTNGVFRSHLQIATVLTPLLSPQPLQCEPTPRRIPPSPQHPSAGTCLLLTARLKAKTSLTKTQENCRSGFCGEKKW